MQDAPQQAEQKLSELTPEQLEAIKGALINTLAQTYTKFIISMRQLPITQVMMQRALGYFDDGFLWMKEGVHHMGAMVNPLVQPRQSQAPSNDGEQTKAQEATQEPSISTEIQADISGNHGISQDIPQE